MSEINLKRNIAFTTTSQVITMVAAFIANWYLARFLGPELRGQYVYLFTVNSVAWLLLDLGISQSLMYSLQRDKADPSALYSMSLVFFGISFVVSIVVFQFFSSRILGDNQYSKLIILALSIYIAVFQLHNRQKFMSIGMNHIKDYSLLLALPSVAFMLLLLPLFWLFPAQHRMQGSYLLNVSVMIVISLVFHRRLVRKMDFHFRWDFPQVKRSYSLGFKAFLSEYMAILMIRADILILKRLGSFAQLGVYTLAINFVDIISVTSNMIGVVLLNKFAALNDDSASLAILRKIFVFMIVFNLVCITGMLLFGHFIISFVYTSEYIGAYKAFIYLIPAVFGLTLGSLFNTFLWSKGFPVFTIIAPAVGALIKVIMSYILIPRFGYIGAAMSSSAVYMLWLIMLMTWYFSTHREQKVTDLIVRKSDIQELRVMLVSLFAKLRG